MSSGREAIIRSGGGGWYLFVLLIAVFGVLLASRVSAQIFVSSDSAPPRAESLAAHLRYREVNFAPTCSEIAVQPVSGFAREPGFNGRRVFRGLFQLGADTNQFVPFVWDSERQRLYLDLNRNRDLTDDAAGALTASGKDLQLFRGIPLEFLASQGAYRVLVDAHVFGQGVKPRVFLYVRSLWEGSIELNGKRWYLAVIDWPDGRIGPATSLTTVGDRMLLRSWEEREQQFLWWHAALPRVHSLDHVKLVTFPYRWAGNAEVFDAFNLLNNLFFAGRAYRMDYRVEPVGGSTSLAVTFNRVSAVPGQLRVDGENVRRAVLENNLSPDGYTAVLDFPTAETTVPAGVYPRQIVLLQREGFANVAVGVATNQIAITASNRAVWPAGGPLKSVAEIIPRDGQVSLNYRLTNNSGTYFSLVCQDEKAPPRFEVRQGDKVVAQSKFSFG